ncbi:hypothetical protein NP493_80g04028 [Ridgeia piscesae]|uniref:Beta-lactamase-related domain-containing protein n=1 Tax=Ridgeia piscesae TaxID=27915 RepID=A0AAD9UI75_RIDPI|nr:hypothetical protein NP493_80g04028 [Ridgeia piscesae]
MLDSWIPTVVGVFVVWVVSVSHYVFEKKTQTICNGFVAIGWNPVAQLFRDQIESGELKGGALSVYHKGELVVEMYGGLADPHSTLEWERHTLSQAYSTTKGIVAVVMAMLVDRGLISYLDPISKHWPEFAAQGKGSITVEQLLSHRAGLPVIDQDFSMFDILMEPVKLSKILATQKPIWEPGTQHGYHGVTFGLYVDQLVKRVDPYHRDLYKFFHEEIAVPFEIDFYIGLPKEENYRCAKAFEFSLFSSDMLIASRYYRLLYTYLTDVDSLINKQLHNPPEMKMDLENSPLYREIPCGSTHGFGTATSIAKLYGILASGGIYKGKQLLSKNAISRLMEPLSVGFDSVLRMDVTYGRGVTLREVQPSGYMFGAPGAGGQMGYSDPSHRLGIGFLTNYKSIFAIGDDPRYLELEQAIYACAKE